MNNEQRKIIGYNPQTGEPIYESGVVGNQISNNQQNVNLENPTTAQFQTGENNNVVQNQYSQANNVQPQLTEKEL